MQSRRQIQRRMDCQQQHMADYDLHETGKAPENGILGKKWVRGDSIRPFSPLIIYVQNIYTQILRRFCLYTEFAYFHTLLLNRLVLRISK